LLAGVPDAVWVSGVGSGVVYASVVGPGVGHRVAMTGTEVSVIIGPDPFFDDTVVEGAVGVGPSDP
jgi:hypothetical protein